VRAQTTKIYNWAITKAESTRSPLWISLLFFLEITLFLPLDAVLMFFCLQNRKKIPLYIILTAIASTLSGLIGYLMGHFLWDLVGPHVVPGIISEATFDKFSLQFQHYESWAVFMGALLPFPLKVLTLSAGVFHLGVVQFVSYFLVARLFRFSLIGGAMMVWGDKVKAFLDRHFHKVMLLVGAKIAAAFGFLWALAK
jgi:membrane protein YqaA with SNARE-associated domain